MTNQHFVKRFRFGRIAVLASVAAAMIGRQASTLPTYAQSAPSADHASTTAEVSLLTANLSGDKMTAFKMDGPGSIAIKNASLKYLIKYAYNLENFQITGGPDWVDSQKFDIALRQQELPPSHTVGEISSFEQQRQAMVRSLLGSRFQLRLIESTKQTPVYTLVVAENGPKTIQRQVAPDAIISVRTLIQEGTLSISGGSNGELAKVLAGQLGCPVEDRTGLNGIYDIALKWEPGNQASLFAALQEQLGLKLEEHISPVPTHQIDRAEKPVLN